MAKYQKMSTDVFETLNVGLGDRSYPIYIGRNLESLIQEVASENLNQSKKVVAVIDQGLREEASSFANEFIHSVPNLSLPRGEKTKSIEFLSNIWDFLAGEGVDRSGVLYALGGGVTGDLVGFAAASYLRGINFYQVPTTLLAMVDSSVGGKTGINLKAGKNLVGAFHQPQAVFIDLECLKTLPKREFSAGMAEVIKYGLLGNESLFNNLLSFTSPLHSESVELPDIIKCCCLEKARIVEEDERETEKISGGRALLNLGHTFAHAIEAVSGYGQYLHGEAVSIGLVCAIRLSLLGTYCSKQDESSLENLLQSYELPVQLNSPLAIPELMNAMQSDKKVSAGKIRFVALKNIGNAFVTSDVSMNEVIKVWKSVGAI